MYFFFSTAMFFAFAIIEYKSLGDQEIFFPWGKKISWSALALAWGDFLLFCGDGGTRRLMKASTYHAVSICICYQTRFVSSETVCKSVGQSTTVNQGDGGQGG